MKLSLKYFNSNSFISNLLKFARDVFLKKLYHLEQPFVKNLSFRSLENRNDVNALSRDKPYTVEFKLKRTKGY